MMSALLIGSLALLVTLPLVKSGDTCLMRGICDKAAFGHIPCIYNGDAQAIGDDEAQKILIEMCPSLAGESTFCCDKDQIMDLRSHYELFGIMLKACPSCFQNYVTAMCHLTCSPKQSKFAKILRQEKNEDGKDMVIEIDYFVHENFIKGLFDSCANVTRFGQRILDVFCKPWSVTKCNPRRMMQYLGSDYEHQGHNPYQIDFVTSVTDKTKFDGVEYEAQSPKVFACNEAVGTMAACPCEHCPSAC